MVTRAVRTEGRGPGERGQRGGQRRGRALRGGGLGTAWRDQPRGRLREGCSWRSSGGRALGWECRVGEVGFGTVNRAVGGELRREGAGRLRRDLCRPRGDTGSELEGDGRHGRVSSREGTGPHWDLPSRLGRWGAHLQRGRASEGGLAEPRPPCRRAAAGFVPAPRGSRSRGTLVAAVSSGSCGKCHPPALVVSSKVPGAPSLCLETVPTANPRQRRCSLCIQNDPPGSKLSFLTPPRQGPGRMTHTGTHSALT